MKGIYVLAAAAAAAAAAVMATALTGAGVAPAAPGRTEAPAPVLKLQNKRFGAILARRDKLPLYYWAREKQAGGGIRCTGRCAVVWPPLVVKRGSAVPARLSGIKGRFGTIKRPDGGRQLTYNGLPLYAYHNDSANVVLCDNVDGWFVVRV